MSTQHRPRPDKGVTPSSKETGQTDSTDPESPGPRVGLCYALSEIEPETLPTDGDPWPEVCRRLAAYREGLDGWRTGAIETQLGEWGGSE